MEEFSPVACILKSGLHLSLNYRTAIFLFTWSNNAGGFGTNIVMKHYFTPGWILRKKFFKTTYTIWYRWPPCVFSNITACQAISSNFLITENYFLKIIFVGGIFIFESGLVMMKKEQAMEVCLFFSYWSCVYNIFVF